MRWEVLYHFLKTVLSYSSINKNVIIERILADLMKFPSNCLDIYLRLWEIFITGGFLNNDICNYTKITFRPMFGQ